LDGPLPGAGVALFDDADDAPLAPAHYLEDAASNPVDLVAQENASRTASRQLASAIRTLDPRSRDILESRWLRDEKVTLMDLAERYGVSAERIRQLERNAMKKLRKHMEQAA